MIGMVGFLKVMMGTVIGFKVMVGLARLLLEWLDWQGYDWSVWIGKIMIGMVGLARL